MAKPAMDIYDEAKRDLGRPPTEKRWEMLLKCLITSSLTPIVFVIDALDECKKKDDYDRLLEFLRRLLEFRRGLPRRSVGYLISSRSHVKVGNYISGSVRMFDVVQPQAKEDMMRFIEGQIESKRKATRWKESIFCK